MSLLQRKTEDLEELRDITDDVDEADFSPYSCHVDPHTILTKNGELLQTVKIVGFTYEDITKPHVDLRASIREALQKAITNSHYAIWLHTIRRKASLRPAGEYGNDFSNILNQAWNHHNHWEHQYINEVYITIVREGQNIPIARPDEFIRGLIPFVEKKFRWGYIERAREELTQAVDVILSSLETFGAKKLGFVEKRGRLISEPVTFLNKLTTLAETPMPVSEVDISDQITSHEITFGFNAMEVRSPNGRRRFGSLLTVKDYREMQSSSVNLLLQTDAEFIITQSLDFINQKDALEEYKKQKEVLEVSEDETIINATGVDKALNVKAAPAVCFGEQQINIFVLGDTVKEMEVNVRKMVRSLSGLGILAIREDIKFEETYWAQLPANFEFLRRLKPISISQVGGFASINNIPAGHLDGSIWGPPVTVMHTAAGTPYFFNFHIENNGHSMIVGPYNAGKTVLLNFLLSEARKFNNRLFFFDRERRSEVFLRSIGADYAHIDYRAMNEKSDIGQYEEVHTLPKLNPLLIDDTPQNRSFLLVWLDACLQADRFYRPEMSEEFWPFFEQALAHVMALPREQRRLMTVIDFLKEHAPQVAAKMYDWYGTGKYARWFENDEDTLDLSKGLVGLELGAVLQDERAAPAIVAYLVHRVMLMLDGSPTIIVLDEAWDLLDNPVFASRLGGWLEALRSRNTMVIFATEKAEDVMASSLSATVMKQVATQIYLPNSSVNSRDYQRIFGLTERECEYITLMERELRHFLLKRGAVSIVATLKLDRLSDLLPILSAETSSLMVLEKLLSTRGKDPIQWLPEFIDEVQRQ